MLGAHAFEVISDDACSARYCASPLGAVPKYPIWLSSSNAVPTSRSACCEDSEGQSVPQLPSQRLSLLKHGVAYLRLLTPVALSPCLVPLYTDTSSPPQLTAERASTPRNHNPDEVDHKRTARHVHTDGVQKREAMCLCDSGHGPVLFVVLLLR